MYIVPKIRIYCIDIIITRSVLAKRIVNNIVFAVAMKQWIRIRVYTIIEVSYTYKFDTVVSHSLILRSRPLHPFAVVSTTRSIIIHRNVVRLINRTTFGDSDASRSARGRYDDNDACLLPTAFVNFSFALSVILSSVDFYAEFNLINVELLYPFYYLYHFKYVLILKLLLSKGQYRLFFDCVKFLC